MRLRNRSDQRGTHLVWLANHFILVKGRKTVDTHTKGEWVFIGKSPHRRRRVKGTWRVERTGSL